MKYDYNCNTVYIKLMRNPDYDECDPFNDHDYIVICNGNLDEKGEITSIQKQIIKTPPIFNREMYPELENES